VELTWVPGAGSPTSFIIEAGSSPGLSDRLTAEAPGSLTQFIRVAQPGEYYVRMRARNGCGISDPSEEVRIAVRLEPPTKPDIVVVPPTEGRRAFFPSVERLRDGQLVVVYYDSPDHVSPGGRIAMVRSADNGLTWSPPRVIIDTPLDDRDPSLI